MGAPAPRAPVLPTPLTSIEEYDSMAELISLLGLEMTSYY